jgi:choline dehydrogenase-like flavoprotein
MVQQAEPPQQGWRRRSVLGGLTGLGAVAALGGAPAVRGKAKPRLVVVGGGAGGLSVARRVAEQGGVEVTVVEANPRYAACFWSNHVYGGLVGFGSIVYGYDGVRGAGIEVVQGRAAAVDRERREVRLADGGRVAYDRLLLAPGIGFAEVPGYDAAARQAMPHAYDACPDSHQRLLRQLRAMPDGGKVLVAVPGGPQRCPPAPYERVSLIAHYLKQEKPKSTIQVIDGKSSFLHQAVTQRAWKERYAGMVEWLPADFIGQVREVDAASKTLHTDFDRFTGDVVNFIPPQRAGDIAVAAGLTDQEGFCPVVYPEMRSRRDPRVFVVGDAVAAHTMPKAATAAISQARSCAGAIRADLLEAEPPRPRLELACYSFLDPHHAVINSSEYAPTSDGGVERVDAYNSDASETAQTRRNQAVEAERWYRGVTTHLFG